MREADKSVNGQRSTVNDSLRAQAIYRVRIRCLHCVHAHSQYGNNRSQKTRQYKYPPLYADPESKILQPVIHSKPGNGKSQDSCDDDQLEEIFRKEGYDPADICTQYFSYTDLFNSLGNGKRRQT